MRFSKTYFLAPWILAFWETLLQQYLPFTVLKLSDLNGSAKTIVACCNSTYRLRYWNIFVFIIYEFHINLLQQYLPFTVLKLYYHAYYKILLFKKGCNSTYRLRYWNRLDASHIRLHRIREVATVLTVYGIETSLRSTLSSLPLAELQQYLPFTVLKRDINAALFPVFKGCNSTYRLRYWNLGGMDNDTDGCMVATVLTVYGIETD